MKVESTLAEVQRSREGAFLTSVKGSKMTLAEMHSIGALEVFAPVNLNERSTESTALVQDRDGCTQSRLQHLEEEKSKTEADAALHGCRPARSRDRHCNAKGLR